MKRDIGKGPWRKGPPPSVGWWPASYMRDRHVLRWYDGSQWSHPAYRDRTAEEAAKRATQPELWWPHEIEWRERADWWPKRSRT